MAWVKVPREHHPLFYAALPNDARIETVHMFGGVAAKVNGHMFAGLFGRSAIVALVEPDRAQALALEGAGLFDPMGNGRVISDKIMLPESVMHDEEELRDWIGRAFKTSARLLPKPPKATTKKPANKAASKIAKKTASKK